jgi:hypothetical protein
MNALPFPLLKEFRLDQLSKPRPKGVRLDVLLHWDWLTPALERCEVEGCGLGLGAKRWWLGALGARSWGEGWGEGEDRAWIVLN